MHDSLCAAIGDILFFSHCLKVEMLWYIRKHTKISKNVQAASAHR